MNPQIALSLYFLWDLLGPSTLTGVAVLILLFPLNGVLYGRIKKLQVSQMRNKDKRTKLVDEILNGMKILKMYAWEMSFVKKVNEIRNTEIVALKKMAYYYAVVMFILTCSPIVIMVVSFASFVLTGGILDPNTAFVSVTLFNLLRAPFTFLPILLVYLVQVHVSMKRLNKYMNSEELDLHAVSHESTKEAVVVKDGVFKWEKESDPVLKNINISIGKGELVAVVGSVGSGKSSLLSALLGEMDIVSGRVNTTGIIAYVSADCRHSSSLICTLILMILPEQSSLNESCSPGPATGLDSERHRQVQHKLWKAFRSQTLRQGPRRVRPET